LTSKNLLTSKKKKLILAISTSWKLPIRETESVSITLGTATATLSLLSFDDGKLPFLGSFWYHPARERKLVRCSVPSQTARVPIWGNLIWP
jgi:hypothetical protein